MTSRRLLCGLSAIGLCVGLIGCEAMPPDDDMDMGAMMGDAEAGKMFYDSNGCSQCHGATGANLADVSSTEVFNRLSGATSHPGGTVSGITQDNANDLAAYFASL